MKRKIKLSGTAERRANAWSRKPLKAHFSYRILGGIIRNRMAFDRAKGRE